jgi:HSP20 family protein
MNMIKFNRPVKPSSFSTVMDDFFNKSFPEVFNSESNFNSPSTNIKETDTAYCIEMAIPGVEKDKINIRVEKDQLIIESRQSSESIEEDEKSNYHMRQFNFSSFRKSFFLNDKIDTDKIEAEYKDGILNITVEKRDFAKTKEPRTISVN